VFDTIYDLHLQHIFYFIFAMYLHTYLPAFSLFLFSTSRASGNQATYLAGRQPIYLLRSEGSFALDDECVWLFNKQTSVFPDPGGRGRGE
jgi:hypothetical protein